MASSACRKWLDVKIGEAARRGKVICQLIARYPHILAVPVVVMALILGLGIMGLQIEQQKRQDDNRQAATWEAVAAAEAFKSDMRQAVSPLLQAAQLARTYPSVPRYLSIWDAVSSSWLKTAPPGTVSFLTLIQGIAARITIPSPDQAPALAFTGFDTLADMSPYRPLVIGAMMAKALTLQGPFKQDGYDMASFAVPVLIPGVKANETWGYDQDVRNCPPGVCYDQVTKTKVWGVFAMNVDTTQFLSQSPASASIKSKGYRMVLTRSGIPQAGEPDRMTVFATSDVSEPPLHAVQVPVEAINQEWQMYVWRGDSWAENMSYLYAIVVIGAILFSALIFAVLLSWAENRALLHSVLPKETIERLREEAQWATSQDECLRAIQMETPAQGLLNMISTCLDGQLPDVSRLVAMRDALQRSVDVYRPTAHTFKERMQKADFMDAEVQQALANQLVDGTRNVLDFEDLTAAGPQPFNTSEDLVESRKASDVKCQQFGSNPYGLLTGTLSTAVNKSMTQLSHASTHSFSRAHSTAAIQSNMRMMLLQNGAAGLPDLSPIASTLHHLMRTPMPESSGYLGVGLNAALPVVQELEHEESRPSVMLHFAAETEDEQTANYQSPTLSLLTQLEQVLATANNWSFDAYALEEASQGYPLSVLGYWLMHSTGLISWARMDAMKLVRFLQHVEDGYSSYNPYHNKRHAADVLQSMHVIMHRGGLLPGFVDHASMLACYLAAIVHDFEHKGRNNDYLVNAYDELAVRYNDRSPMENHHLAAAFGVLRHPDCDCLAGLSKATFNKIRKLMIELVLATDMKQHFAIVGQFGALHTANSDCARNSSLDSTGRTGRITTDGQDSHRNSPSSVGSPRPVVPTSECDRLLSLQMAFKCADLGHLTAPLNVHLRWVGALEEEFFIQGDAEKAQGLPVSPLCDRTKEGVYKSQVGFITVVVMPLFTAFAKRFVLCKPLLKALSKNQVHWQSAANQKLPTQLSHVTLVSHLSHESRTSGS